jgi:hypothetical protein
MSPKMGVNQSANGGHRSAMRRLAPRSWCGWIGLVLAIWETVRALVKGCKNCRIDYGPGYRVHVGQEGTAVVLLLCGGDKSTQPQDIEAAKRYWMDYRRRS